MHTTSHALRRRSDRRQQERRNLELEFNSAAWIEYMQSHFVLWPKLDRRQHDRRHCDRRIRDRRMVARGLAKYRNNARYHLGDILSDEERRLIQELFVDESRKNRSA